VMSVCPRLIFSSRMPRRSAGSRRPAPSFSIWNQLEISRPVRILWISQRNP
jgi:hypothetical protein